MPDPDASVIAIFSNMAIPNPAKTREAGRPIFEDKEVCQLRYPGRRDNSFHLAIEVSHWHEDPETGEQVQVTYAERFSRQYRQFKEHATQTKSGTPLAYAPFLTEARRAELRALNIYTVEMLAALDGIELKNLGPGGRDLKNQAMAHIEETKAGAPNLQMVAELEALRARNALLEEDNKLMKAQLPEPEDNFDEMTLEQLRDYIATNTGHQPHGTPNKRTLIRMARGLGKSEVAA
jgi:hypothetical protein